MTAYDDDTRATIMEMRLLDTCEDLNTLMDHLSLWTREEIIAHLTGIQISHVKLLDRLEGVLAKRLAESQSEEVS
jgi:hypothetical protein